MATITKELLIGFTGKRDPVPGQMGTGCDAHYKLLTWDNKELFRDELEWLRHVDSYDMVLLITVEDNHLVPSVRKLYWERRLRLKGL